MKTAFARTLEVLAKANEDIYLLTGDLGFGVFDRFRQLYPKRFVNVGVAEANMIGVAAGLALSGKTVYCYSIIPFLVMRPLERIRVDLCYHNVKVNLVGVGGGLSYGLEGMTHHAVEDVAIMRSLPNMTVVAPGDPQEVITLIGKSVEHEGPLYVRLGRSGEPHVYDDVPALEIGKGIVIYEGSDITLIATGTMLSVAKFAAEDLMKIGLDVRLISMHTIRPLDTELVRACAIDSKAIFTVEEHSVNGGLGTAVAEVLLEFGYQGRFTKIGLPDQYCPHVGKGEYLRQQYNLTRESIVARILIEYQKCPRAAIRDRVRQRK